MGTAVQGHALTSERRRRGRRTSASSGGSARRRRGRGRCTASLLQVASGRARTRPAPATRAQTPAPARQHPAQFIHVFAWLTGTAYMDSAHLHMLPEMHALCGSMRTSDRTPWDPSWGWCCTDMCNTSPRSRESNRHMAPPRKAKAHIPTTATTNPNLCQAAPLTGHYLIAITRRHCKITPRVRTTPSGTALTLGTAGPIVYSWSVCMHFMGAANRKYVTA